MQPDDLADRGIVEPADSLEEYLCLPVPRGLSQQPIDLDEVWPSLG